MLSTPPPHQRKSWDQHGLRAHILGPAPDHYWCCYVFVSSTQTPRYSHSVDHYPDPLFHWSLPETPPPLSQSHPLRPHPASDGSDLLGRVFLDPELGRCTVSYNQTQATSPPAQGSPPGITTPSPTMTPRDDPMSPPSPKSPIGCAPSPPLS